MLSIQHLFLILLSVHSYDGIASNGRRTGAPLDHVTYPWFALLLEDNEDGSFCGGSLISHTHLLTAAHCFNGRTTDLEQIYQVTLGLYDRCDPGSEARTFQVAHVHIHEKYVELDHFDDIALLTLATSDAGFTPIHLPLPGVNIDSVEFAYIIGFGATEKIHEPCLMSEAKLPILSRHECGAAKYEPAIQTSLSRTNKALCAGYLEGGWSACDGDSGGPLMVKLNNKYYIKGIISFVPTTGCSDSATVFTNVVNYVPWILNAMRHPRVKAS